MNFKVKVSAFMESIKPVVTCSTVGGKRDYADVGKFTLELKGNELSAFTNNGFVAVIKTLFPANQSPDFTPSADGVVTVTAVDFINTFAAFAPDDMVNVSFDGKIIKVQQDGATDDQEQTLPAVSTALPMPNIEKSFDSEFTISREVFVESASGIMHTIGDERFKPQLRFWKMIVEDDSIKVIAGDGGRYEIYERQGKGFVSTKEKINFYLSRDHSPSLIKMLSDVGDQTVLIKEKKAPKSEYAEQVLFELANVKIVVLGYDPGTKYPDVFKLSSRTSPVKVITVLEDWKYVCNGIDATNNKDQTSQNIYHVMDLDFTSKKISVKAKGTMTSSRTIYLKDITGAAKIRIGGDYFRDIISKHSGKAQFELVDEKSPLICRLYAGDKLSDGPFEKINNATKESRTIMIAPRK
jgi:DNA polymerase III sliding clamp (beta) subunit (PCNA family)